MWGTIPTQKPTAPSSRIPAISTVPRVITASTAVTLMLPVAEAMPGISPSRLLNRMKKKTVQR